MLPLQTPSPGAIPASAAAGDTLLPHGAGAGQPPQDITSFYLSFRTANQGRYQSHSRSRAQETQTGFQGNSQIVF